MRRHRAILVGAGLWAAVAAAQTGAVHLAPTSFRVIYGMLSCCDATPDCDRISREIDALYAADKECLMITLGNPVELELTFETSVEPNGFQVRIVSNTSWQDVVTLRNWDDGGFDEIPMSEAAEDGSSVSGIVPASYLHPGTGRIVLRLTSYALAPARDDKTIDVVDIVIPPP